MSFENHLYLYYDAIGRELEAHRHDELARLDSREDALAHVARVRARLQTVLKDGGFAGPTGQSRVLSTFVKNGVRIDKVLYECRPHIYGTGLFMRKEGLSQQVPGLIVACGHAKEGKGSTVYHSLAMVLALKGFGVFIVDPEGQGERAQFGGEPTLEHNVFGKALLAAGRCPAAVFIHDIRVAIDYLQSRPEIRAGGIGITGNSGGGQMSYYMFGVDDRIEAAAASCHMGTLRWNFRNEIATDSESSPINLLGCGSDRPDFAIAGAPKDLLLMGTRSDFVDLRGLQDAAAQIGRVYELLGAADRFSLFIGDGPHGYHQAQREAMYGFFTKHFLGVEDTAEPEGVEPLTPEEYTVTPTGRTNDIAGARTEQAYALSLAPLPACKATREAMRAFLRASLSLPLATEAVADYRTLRPMRSAAKVGAGRYAVETEPGKMPLAVLYTVEDSTHPLIPQGRQAILQVAADAALEELPAEPFTSVDGVDYRNFALDVRGIGALRSTAGDTWKADYYAHCGHEYFMEVTSRLMGRPILGGKLRDVYESCKLLKANGYEQIILKGRGLGAVVAALAVIAYDLKPHDVCLEDFPRNLRELLLTDTGAAFPQSHIPYGMLQLFDFADVYDIVMG